MVGALLNVPTVIAKLVEAEVVPSLTVSVIVATPDWLGAGVNVTVRLDSEPPKTMFAFGITSWFEETPATARSTALVSKSPIVNARGGVVVFSRVD